MVEYGRSLGQAVAGGVVYRGPTVRSMDQFYFYADIYSGRIWAFRHVDGAVVQHHELPSRLRRTGIVNFALRLAPYAVTAMIYSVVVKIGFDILVAEDPNRGGAIRRKGQFAARAPQRFSLDAGLYAMVFQEREEHLGVEGILCGCDADHGSGYCTVVCEGCDRRALQNRPLHRFGRQFKNFYTILFTERQWLSAPSRCFKKMRRTA